MSPCLLLTRTIGAVALLSALLHAQTWPVVARSADGSFDVRIVPGTGLVVERDGEVVFRDPEGAFPRFDVDGTLIFETAYDDGHMLFGRKTWRWSPSTGQSRKLGDSVAIPPWRPLVGNDASGDGGDVRLCIDPGHGGSDPGAVGNGLLEKDIVLDVGLRLRDLLDADTADASGGGAWDVLMTRDTDVFISLLQRVTLANTFGADSFISIHANGFGDPAANGTETFAFAEGTVAASLRDRIHARMIEAWQLTDRGTKTAGFYVLVNTAMPASLSELAFVTNPGDALVLGNPAERQQAARAHLFAAQEHHGFAPYEPGGGPTAGTLKGILFDANVGTSAPLAGALVALADGTFTTTTSNGLYEFPLPAGTYSFAATAAGFDVGTASETVTSGDVWESLGLATRVAPTLATTVVGHTLTLAATGDPATPVFLAAALFPQLPALSLGNKGTLWVDVATLVVVPLGNAGPTGVASTIATLPSLPGATGVPLHLQAIAVSGGSTQLSNGTAFALP